MGRRGFTSEFAEKNGLAVDRYPLTPEEVQQAEDALTADLAKLSLVDQERIVFDIHGLEIIGDDSDIENDEKKLEAAFKAIEEEIQKIDADRKSAYEEARYLNPAYVEGRDLRLKFLRCANYDASLAADQIVQHFQAKQRLFCSSTGNDDVLGRPLLMSDMTEGAMKYLERGACHILPNRDASGRVVVFMSPAHLVVDDLADLYRGSFYLHQVASTEEGITKDGLVMIYYCVGKYKKLVDWNLVEDMFDSFFDGVPAKVAAMHVCYDDPKMRDYMASASVFLDEITRHRIRPHFGTKEEVLFKLQTQGIVTEDLPINDEGTLDLTWYRQWLGIQKKRESEKATSAESRHSVLVPRRFDVLFGRGCDTRVHVGNLRAVHLVETEFERYEQASKQEKTVIATGIVRQIQKSYGRFLKWEEGGWVEVDFNTARNKVSHFFRRRRLRKKADPPPEVQSEE